ncbi:MAG: hypothetical protein ABIP13_01835 [Tepidiformaceae bacterium]
MADLHPELPTPLAEQHGHEAHPPADPNAAPLRQDVRETFSRGAVAFCAILGAVAIIGGTVAGLTIVNN